MSKSNENKQSGFATAGLVLGIIGIVFSFIPIINNFAFALGVLALIFGIISLIKKANTGKAVAGVILGILSIVITLSMQSAFSKAIDETQKTLDEVSEDLDKAAGNSTEEILKKEINVTLGNFNATTDEYGITDSELDVTVKNITNKRKSYSIHIEAIDADGKRIDEDYVYANDLNAGQTQDFQIFTLVGSDKAELLKSATFKIVEVSSY